MLKYIQIMLLRPTLMNTHKYCNYKHSSTNEEWVIALDAANITKEL